MANPPRQKGTRWETACKEFVSRLWTRVRRTGSRAYERGDLEYTPPYTLECKAHRRYGKADLEKWVDQAEAARIRTGTKIKGVLIKRFNKPTEKGLFVTTIGEWLQRETYIRELERKVNGNNNA